jgi:O-antigen/teichoic acid export membrane protein
VATPAAPPGLFASAGLTLATRFAAFFFSLATNVILARGLGPDGRGVYAVAVLIPALIGLLVQLGIGPANVYYFSKQLIDADELIGHATSLALGLGSICFAAVLIYGGAPSAPGGSRGFRHRSCSSAARRSASAS